MFQNNWLESSTVKIKIGEEILIDFTCLLTISQFALHARVHKRSILRENCEERTEKKELPSEKKL